MKANFLLKGIAMTAILFLTSCSKDNATDSNVLTADDANATSKMDQATNAISTITEDQVARTFIDPSTGKGLEPNPNILPCATITINPQPSVQNPIQPGTTVTKTIDFGTGCDITNKIHVSGKIIISFLFNPGDANHTATITFDHFTHNGKTIDGTKSITKTIGTSDNLATPHPIFTSEENLSVTFKNGKTYTRVGTKTRECIAGFQTASVLDNVYLETGSHITTRPNGKTFTATITTPLRIEVSCLSGIVSGVVTIAGPEHTLVIDYGDGTCDALATRTIDGGTPVQFDFTSDN